MRELILNVAQRLGIILGGGLLAWQILIGIQALSNYKVQYLYGEYLFLALVLVFLSYALQVVSWGVLMRGLQVYIPCGSLFRGYILSFLPRYIPGSVWGYLSRSEWLRAEFQVSYAVSAKGSLLELSVATVSAGVVAAIYCAKVLEYVWRWWLIIGLVLVLGIFWIGVVKIQIFQSILGTWSALRLPKCKLPILNLLVSVALISWNMLWHGLAIYLAARGLAMDIHFSPDILFTFAADFSIAWLIGFVIFILPSGIGLREVSFSALLTLNTSLTFDLASVLSVAYRLVITCAELLWVCVGLLLYRIKR